jgi:hypothetical protein
MAFLDYYAFEAKKEAARNSLRILSEKQLPTFIYSAIGYQPSPPQPMLPPKPLRRPLRGPIPEGYFSVFHAVARGEIRGVQMALNLGGYPLSYVTIEKAWHRYWDTQALWQQYGPRRVYLRKCLDTVPQRTIDGYIPTYVYPIAAWDGFKRWLNWQYIPDRFPSYLQRKIQASARKPALVHRLLPS